MIVNGGAAVVLGLDAIVVATVLFWPLSRRYDGFDRGDGMAGVLLPSPRRRSPWRTAWLFGVFALLCAGILWLRSPDLNRTYVKVLETCVSSVIGNPALVHGYLAPMPASIELVITAFILALAVSLPASPLRRLIIALNAVVFLGAALAAQTALATVGLLTGMPIGPFACEAAALNLLLGFAILTRLKFTTFQLPRLTTVRRRRPPFRADRVLFALAAITALTVAGAVAAAIGNRLNLDPSLQVVTGFVVVPYLSLFLAALAFLCWLGPDAPPIGADRPALDVIIPAYNEAEGIVATLQSIDAAAAVYRGRVRIVLADDGSTDGTGDIARRAMDAFRAATGVVISTGHGGKARALNAALAACTADIVIRIDADCTCGDDAFLYTVPWFARPDVGTVGAFTVPLPRLRGWVHHMRRLECAAAFGFGRYALQVVDGISCIPGTYTAFRRAAAVSVGGFVEGMNGEDADLTLQIGRLGFRAVMDQRVHSFEDAPDTLAELREQRIRWYRGGLQVFARHDPFGAGPCGARTWFTMPRNQRLTTPLRLAMIIYLAELGVFHASFRRTLVTLAVVYLLGQLPWITLAVVLCLRHGLTRSLAWLPLWIPFVLVRCWCTIDAMMTLPTRPGLAALRARSAGEPWRPVRLRGGRAPLHPSGACGAPAAAPP